MQQLLLEVQTSGSEQVMPRAVLVRDASGSSPRGRGTTRLVKPLKLLLGAVQRDISLVIYLRIIKLAVSVLEVHFWWS